MKKQLTAALATLSWICLAHCGAGVDISAPISSGPCASERSLKTGYICSAHVVDSKGAAHCAVYDARNDFITWCPSGQCGADADGFVFCKP